MRGRFDVLAVWGARFPDVRGKAPPRGGFLAEVHVDLLLRDAVEGGPQRARVFLRDDPLLRQHHEMRVVDRHQRRQQELLGVFEIFIQYVRDVLGSKLHLSPVYRA